MLFMDCVCSSDPMNCHCGLRTKRELRRLLYIIGLTMVMIPAILLFMNSPYNKRLPSVSSIMEVIHPHQKPHITSEQEVYICGIVRGKIGNAFFLYISLLGIARANNMTLVLKDDDSALLDVLEHPPETARDFDKKCEDAWYQEQRKCCAFDKKLVRLPHDDRYLIYSCLISWKYFEGIKGEVKTLLEFRKDVRVEAEKIVGEVRKRSGSGATLVGLHVRRGDQSGFRAFWNGRNPVTPEYVTRAMRFFTTRFRHVHFLVASDDTEWCRKYVSRSDVTIMEGNSAAVDLAALTLTDHMIVSIGTFGWWAGYLNPGIKVYMKNFIGAHSSFLEAFDDQNATDYIYPGWIGL